MHRTRPKETGRAARRRESSIDLPDARDSFFRRLL